MVVYRNFSTNEKSMQEIIREVIISEISKKNYEILNIETVLNKLQTSNSSISDNRKEQK